MSVLPSNLTAATFRSDVNDVWMEALDVGSGRLYFVKLEKARAKSSARRHTNAKR